MKMKINNYVELRKCVGSQIYPDDLEIALIKKLYEEQISHKIPDPTFGLIMVIC